MVILRFDLTSEKGVRLEVTQIMASDAILLQGLERRNAGVSGSRFRRCPAVEGKRLI